MRRLLSSKSDWLGGAGVIFAGCSIPCLLLLGAGCVGPAADPDNKPKEIAADWGQASSPSGQPTTGSKGPVAPASSDKLASSNQNRKQRLAEAYDDAAQPTRRAPDGGWSEHKQQPSSSPVPRLSPEAAKEAAAEAERRKAALLERIVARSKPSLVAVKVRKAGREAVGNVVIGSGFVASQAGVIVANYHVVDGAESAEVVFSDGQTKPVLGCVGFAPGQDLVLLRISSSDELKPLRIADKVEQGEPAAVFSGPDVVPPTVTQITLSGVRYGKAIRHLIAYEAGKAFDMEAAWVQIPSATSWDTGGGGPLVNLLGEVVALPTSFRMGGQSIGFAIAAENIGALVREAGTRVLPLALLPKSAPEFSSAPGGQKLTVPFVQIELPSGVRLTEDTVAIPADWKQALLPSGVNVYLSKYPKGGVQGIHSFDAGKLNGVSALLQEDGKLKSLATYKAARRHGPLRLWDDEGQLLLYADYRGGNKQGVSALFRDGKPWMVQEWAAGKLASESLIYLAAGIPDTVAPRDLSPKQQPELDSAQAQLAKIEQVFEERERAAKQELMKWYREEDEKIKKERVAQLAPQRRQRMLERQRQEAATAAAAMESAWQSAAQQNYQRSASGRARGVDTAP